MMRDSGGKLSEGGGVAHLSCWRVLIPMSTPEWIDLWVYDGVKGSADRVKESREKNVGSDMGIWTRRQT